MKKITITIVLIAILFAIGMYFLKDDEKNKTTDNIYKKENLHTETINDLDNPHYQNIILPEELKKAINNKENITVYFYSPTCGACREASPLIHEASKKVGHDVKLMNLLEFENGWDDYKIEYTPTIVRYENGKEISRIVSLQEEGVYEDWLREWE